MTYTKKRTNRLWSFCAQLGNVLRGSHPDPETSEHCKHHHGALNDAKRAKSSL